MTPILRLSLCSVRAYFIFLYLCSWLRAPLRASGLLPPPPITHTHLHHNATCTAVANLTTPSQPGLSATSGLESTFGWGKSLQNGRMCAVNCAGTLARIGVIRDVALGAVKKTKTGRWQLTGRVDARV